MYPYCRVPRTVTCLYVYLILNCLALCRFALVEADVVVITQKSNYTVDIFSDLPASFGRILPSNGLRGYVVGANPKNACAPIEPPPKLDNYTGNWFVVIKRYDCNFVDKVRQAQIANYDAAIIHNVGSNSIEPMSGEDADDINISAVFIGQDDGLTILSHYQYEKGYKLLLTDELPFNINSYLLPFAIVVAICFVVMLVFMIVKCIKDRRRMRRYRLPSSSLKTIPTSKFKKGDPYDTCAICLEDYIDGDKLRILPCAHAYHCKCIDPWLTRNRRVCPVCKRRVLARGEHFSDSESDTEDSETRPLLRPGSYGTQGGTFSQQRDNPLMNQDVAHMESTPVQVEEDEPDAASIEAVVIESQPREFVSALGHHTPDQLSVSSLEGVAASANRSSTPLDPSHSVAPALQTPPDIDDSTVFFTPQNSRRSPRDNTNDTPVDI